MQALKNAIKETLRHYGVSISSIQAASVLPLTYRPFDLLFDVGANTGQFAMESRKHSYGKTIVSFEPLADAPAALQAHAAGDSQWIVHERCAVGAAPGEALINVSANSFSSSLLPMLASHSSAAPDSAYVGVQPTRVITLDAVFHDYWQPGRQAFLKIDTQGFEKDVLAGAAESLEHIVGVEVEMSVVPLYESQSLYDYFFDFFKREGFMLWTLRPAFVDSRTGQLLQFDATFVRPV